MSDEKGDRPKKLLTRRSTRNSPSRTEFDFIDLVKNRAFQSQVSNRLRHSSLLQGIGDDCAVIRQSTSHDLVITTDLLIEDIDFRLEWTSAQLLGHKALAISLSDIAAMGAVPRYALLSIGIPRKLWKTNFVDEFYEGFFALADQHNVTLIGGDVSRTPDRVVIDSILVGEVKRDRSILRTGAKPGDHIFVTGCLGGAAAGLKLLDGGTQVSEKKLRSSLAVAEQNLLLHQVKPEPRVAWGVMLGENRLATAMIDISDGLSSDLIHLCNQSGVGARIDAEMIPIDPNIMKTGVNDPDSVAFALNGGEDFELLFTVNPKKLERLPAKHGDIAATHIGHITKESVVLLVNASRTVPLTPAGFRHF